MPFAHSPRWIQASTTSSAGSDAVASTAIEAIGTGVRARSRSRHSRELTMVSQPGRLSIGSLVECSRNHACWESADEIIQAQDQHLKDLVKAGDDVHVPARADMKGRWRHPKKSMSWYTDVKKRFAALPES